MKKIIVLLLALVMLISFACTKKDGSTETAKPSESAQPDSGKEGALVIDDVTAFGRSILTGCTFEFALDEFDDLAFAAEQLKISSDKLNMIDGKPEMFRAIANSEEVLVVGAKDEAAAKEILEGAVADRITYLREGYSDYGPDQVPKINSCVKMTAGRYVILVISNDNTAAQKVVNDLLDAAKK